MTDITTTSPAPPGETVIEDGRSCLGCQKPLTLVGPPSEYQFDNALWLGFFGGYGMFVDNAFAGDRNQRILAGADHEAVICHGCAHRLCETVPWVGALLDPHRSHSHRPEFLAAHPDHAGWDTDPAS